MSVREEDIDYSDIPPLEIKEGMVIKRIGNKYREAGKRNLAFINKLIREHEERKAAERG